MGMAIFKSKPLEFDMVTTRGGDKGTSTLYSGERMPKDELVFELVGTIDELTSHIGLIKNLVSCLSLYKPLTVIQDDLYRIMSTVCTSQESDLYKTLNHVNENDIVNHIEKVQKRIQDEVEIPSAFVIPGKTMDSAHVHITRTVCRRAERRMVRFISNTYIMRMLKVTDYTEVHNASRYLNRLSDLLFVLSRLTEKEDVNDFVNVP